MPPIQFTFDSAGFINGSEDPRFQQWLAQPGNATQFANWVRTGIGPDQISQQIGKAMPSQPPQQGPAWNDPDYAFPSYVPSNDVKYWDQAKWDQFKSQRYDQSPGAMAQGFSNAMAGGMGSRVPGGNPFTQQPQMTGGQTQPNAPRAQRQPVGGQQAVAGPQAGGPPSRPPMWSSQQGNESSNNPYAGQPWSPPQTPAPGPFGMSSLLLPSFGLGMNPTAFFGGSMGGRDPYSTMASSPIFSQAPGAPAPNPLREMYGAQLGASLGGSTQMPGMGQFGQYASGAWNRGPSWSQYAPSSFPQQTSGTRGPFGGYNPTPSQYATPSLYGGNAGSYSGYTTGGGNNGIQPPGGGNNNGIAGAPPSGGGANGLGLPPIGGGTGMTPPGGGSSPGGNGTAPSSTAMNLLGNLSGFNPFAPHMGLGSGQDYDPAGNRYVGSGAAGAPNRGYVDPLYQQAQSMPRQQINGSTVWGSSAPDIHGSPDQGMPRADQFGNAVNPGNWSAGGGWGNQYAGVSGTLMPFGTAGGYGQQMRGLANAAYRQPQGSSGLFANAGGTGTYNTRGGDQSSYDPSSYMRGGGSSPGGSSPGASGAAPAGNWGPSTTRAGYSQSTYPAAQYGGYGGTPGAAPGHTGTSAPSAPASSASTGGASAGGAEQRRFPPRRGQQPQQPSPYLNTGQYGPWSNPYPQALGQGSLVIPHIGG